MPNDERMTKSELKIKRTFAISLFGTFEFPSRFDIRVSSLSVALALQMDCCIVTARNGWVAQLAEQWTENPRVAGSIPAPATFLLMTFRAALKRMQAIK